MDAESVSGIILFMVLPLTILGFMVYLTYTVRRAQAKKNNSKRKK